MLGTIASSLILPFAGQLIDHYGTRVMVVLSALGLGLSLMILSQCDHIIQTMGIRSVFFVSTVIFLCFLLIRFFGQGCLTMTSRVSIGKWFNHRRGLATAISGVFVAFGFNASPMLLDRLVQTFSWRGTYILLALSVGGGMSLLGWIFYRDNPEQCGLVMDGVTDESWHQKMAARVGETLREFTRIEAMRTQAFWIFNLGLAAISLVFTALTFHITSLGEEMGLNRSQSFVVFLPMSLFGIVANLLGGWISDRLKLKWLLIAMMAAQAIGTTGLLSFGEPLGRILFIVGFGVTIGLFPVLVTVTWPRFYGRKHLGAISGLNMSIMVFASAIGPAAFSIGRNLTGSYQTVVLICWFLPILVILGGIRANNPQ